MGAFRLGLVVTAFAFGFRHGIDWDHIAALTDITGSQDEGRRSMVLATMYALGHALVVFSLGVLAIALAERLPASVDGVMERVVGATLVLLGLYVVVSLIRHGRQFRMRSRWMLLFAAVRRAGRWLRHGDQVVLVTHEHPHHEGHHAEAHATVDVDVAGASRRTATVLTAHGHGHRHVGTLPDDPFVAYGKPTAFGVGMLHGVGAETPTQVLVFLAAAGAGGTVEGLVLLGCFITGLLTSNSLIAAAGTFGFLRASRNWSVYASVSVVTAVFSLVVGTIFLVGQSTTLPAFFGG